MIRRVGAFAALVLALALPVAAEAEAPGTSPRPEPRPGAAPPVSATTAAVRTVVEQLPTEQATAGARAVPALRPRPRPVVAAPAPSLPAVSALVAGAAPVPPVATPEDRPRARPGGGLFAGLRREGGPSPAPPPTVVPGPEPDVVASAAPPRPEERPSGLGRLFQRAAQPAPPSYPRSGSVCGDRAIRGEPVAPIGNPRGGCGIAEPVRITEVAGIRLTMAATVDCSVARALKTWIEQGARPAVGRTGGGLEQLRVAAHYVCRNRNNQRGGRLSEHARGRAIDISAIILADGTEISVLRGWRHRTHGPILKRMHASACGPFGTVLGPQSDRFHQDHLHFDTASYRSGPYCR